MTQDDEVYNPPEPGYEQKLESVAFVPLIDTYTRLMKESGYFNHVSSWFGHLMDVVPDMGIPTVMFNLPDGTFEQVALTKGYEDAIVTMEVHYFSKHLQRNCETEIYHFIEKTIQIIESNKKIKFKYKPDSDTSKCDIRMAKVVGFMTEFDYDGNYIIRHGVVTAEVRLPLCKHLNIV